MMTATAKVLLRMLDMGKIGLDQISETDKWRPYKREVEAELQRREGGGE